MTTTIKVSDETKQLLDMLQARMTLKFQKKKTLTELIDAITRIALKHENELLESGKLPPLTKILR
jgi:predicted transcriptional regulator